MRLGLARLAVSPLLVTIGVVIGAASFAAPASAAIFCTPTIDTGVAALDNKNEHFGNGAEIYINTKATVDGFVGCGVTRSVFVTTTNYFDDVELGWASDPKAGYQYPFVYTENLVS